MSIMLLQHFIAMTNLKILIRIHTRATEVFWKLHPHVVELNDGVD